jgi:hypothetical protein
MIDTTVFLLGGCFGGALVWHFKTWFITFAQGAEAALVKAKAEVASLEAKISAAKAAVK